MSRSNRRVAVVLASSGDPRRAGPSLSGFAREVEGRGEVILAVSPTDRSDVEGFRAALPTCRVLDVGPGRLAPELWAAGIDATDAPYLAFSTTQMAPEPGWLAALLSTMEATEAAAVGGPIEPGTGLGRFDRAVYLHRYGNYRLPWPTGERIEPPGDNALYDRGRLEGIEPSWADGFWEVEVHRHLRGRGERLAMAEGAAVRFLGGAAVGPTIAQRFRHARNYGASRSRGLSATARLLRASRAPAVPPLLLARSLGGLRTRGESAVDWGGALPSLGLVLAAWATGEALGTCFPGARPSGFVSGSLETQA